MKLEGNDESLPPQPAAPSPTNPTRTSEQHPAVALGPAPTQSELPIAGTQVRDPDRYQILNEHGRGGLGRVSRAHDRELCRDVAIKELISRGNVHEVRFLREALITARLEHPGIVPVHEAGRWPDGTPFYAMKLVSGRPLRDLISERTSVDQRIGLLHHVIAVADAIAYAHGRNIIHRDLKPSNVIIGDFGETVVIDWGLAKDLSANEEPIIGGGPFRTHQNDDLTVTGSVLGTPAYMAPEQARGEHVDQRADVFAIGAMLWELCSLQRVPPTNERQRHRMLRRAGIDKDLITIIDKTLAPDPDRRYRDAASLAADLKAFKSGVRIAARSYSLLAMLAHWTRRHRALAFSAMIAVALTTAAVVLYIRNITAERDRADTTLALAQQERDRAQLAEASLLLEKDPTKAKALLASLAVRSPQHALLLSRAKRLAAAQVIRLPGKFRTLLRTPSMSGFAVVTDNGDLASVDIDAGVVHVLDHDLSGPATSDGTGLLYARQSPGSSSVTIAGTTTPHILDTGPVLSDVTGTLLVAASHIYALDNNNLYVLETRGPVLMRPGVRHIAGSDHIFMLCTTDNALEVFRDDIVERRTRCAKNFSMSPMVTVGNDYAALLDMDHLLLVRDGKALELSTHISGEYAFALSSSGLFALADFDDKTWFVRPGGDHLELGPAHASRPMASAADDRYVAWGYMDGVVIVLDTKSNTVWNFKGHGSRVSSVAIDAAHSRALSISGFELRVWALLPTPLTKIADMPCTVFNLTRSPDEMHAAIDCDDGNLRIWSFATMAIKMAHHHSNYAFGVAWLRDLPCSAGFDGRVLCTSHDGSTQEILAVATTVRWLISSPDHEKLVMATADGKIRAFDGALHTLYTHDATPYRMAVSPDGHFLASGAADGSLIIYDFTQQRVIKTSAHSARVMSVVWRNHDLWTSSSDGTMKHWSLEHGTLTMSDSIHEEGSFRFLHRFKGGWLANIDAQFLRIKFDNSASALQFDLDRHVERVEMSPDERYVATTMAGEVIIVDVARRAVASLSIPSDGIGYVGFGTNNLLVVSNGSHLFTISASALEYVNFRVIPTE